MEQLLEEKLNEVWTKREERSHLERKARNQLMEEVMEARRLQIQNKCENAAMIFILFKQETWLSVCACVCARVCSPQWIGTGRRRRSFRKIGRSSVEPWRSQR